MQYVPATLSSSETEVLPALSRSAKAFGDAEVLQLWLSIFDSKSPETARHYRTQTNKYLLFLRLSHPEWPTNSHLKLATEIDVLQYEQALKQDLPVSHRLASELSKDELILEGLDEQPFKRKKTLKESTVNQAIAVLNALYEYMRVPNGGMPVPYVSINHVRRVRKLSSRTPKMTERLIPIGGIKAMREYLHFAIARATACSDRAAQLRYERMLWLFTLLFGLWGRRDELSKLTMGDFIQDERAAWKAVVHRKGGKTQALPVANWVIEGLRRYRASIGLPRNWDKGDITPAICGIRDQEKPKSTKTTKPIGAYTIYSEIKQLAKDTAKALETGILPESVAELTGDLKDLAIKALENCSPHWFRHTGPSIAINSGAISVELASKMLGHSSIDTTSQMYFHANDNKIRDGIESLDGDLSD